MVKKQLDPPSFYRKMSVSFRRKYLTNRLIDKKREIFIKRFVRLASENLYDLISFLIKNEVFLKSTSMIEISRIDSHASKKCLLLFFLNKVKLQSVGVFLIPHGLLVEPIGRMPAVDFPPMLRRFPQALRWESCTCRFAFGTDKLLPVNAG